MQTRKIKMWDTYFLADLYCAGPYQLMLGGVRAL